MLQVAAKGARAQAYTQHQPNPTHGERQGTGQVRPSTPKTTFLALKQSLANSGLPTVLVALKEEQSMLQNEGTGAWEE